MASINSDPNLAQYYGNVTRGYEQQLEAEKERQIKMRLDDRTKLEKTYNKALEEKDAVLEKHLEDTRAAQREYRAAEKAQHMHDVDQLKRELYTAHGTLSHSIPLDTHEHLIAEQMDASAQQMERSQSGREQLLKEHTHQLQEHDEETKNRVEDLTQQTKAKAHELNEHARTREQQAELNAEQKIASFRREHEDQRNILNDTRRKLSETFQSDVNHLKTAMENQKTSLTDRQQTVQKEQATKFDHDLMTHDRDHKMKLDDARKRFDINLENLAKREQTEKNASERLLSKTTDALEQQNRNNLASEATAARKYIEESHKRDQNTIDQLGKELAAHKTSKDVALVAPAAFDAIRNQVVEDYEKRIGLVEAKSNNLHKELTERYTRPLADLRESFANRATQLISEHKREQSAQKSELNEIIDDTSYWAQSRMRDQETAARRDQETLTRQFSLLMDRQRRDYERIIQEMRSDASEKLSDAHKETASTIKENQKNLITKQSEVIREFEKRISDQKAEFEYTLDELRTKNIINLKDAEKKSKQEFDVQSKAYEAKFKQVEAQYQERERSRELVHQEELEKMHKSYEMMTKKK